MGGRPIIVKDEYVIAADLARALQQLGRSSLEGGLLLCRNAVWLPSCRPQHRPCWPAGEEGSSGETGTVRTPRREARMKKITKNGKIKDREAGKASQVAADVTDDAKLAEAGKQQGKKADMKSEGKPFGNLDKLT
jgi:hypothetical protein